MRYTEEQKQFLLETIPGHSQDEIAELFNARFLDRKITPKKVAAWAKNNNVRRGTKGGRHGSKLYPPDIEKFLKETYESGRSRAETTRMVNKKYGTEYTLTQVTTYIKNHKLCNGRDTKFKKGRKGDPELGRRIANMPEVKKTRFKKGRKPHNTLPVGAETVRGDGYVWVKVAEPDKWKLKQYVIWEQAHGPVPEGMMLTFKDGNQKNTSLNNLILVDRAVSLYLNRYNLRSENADLTECAVNLGRLATMTRRKERNRKETNGTNKK